MNESTDLTYAGSGIYREHILDHFKSPRNHGALPGAFSHREFNPLCGDTITMHLRIRGGLLEAVRFSGSGCAISQAAASMLTELAEGKPLERLKQMTSTDVLALLHIPIGPVRLKCALLGLDTLKNAILLYEKSQSHGAPA